MAAGRSTIFIVLLSKRRKIIVVWVGTKSDEKRREKRRERGIGRDVGRKIGPIGSRTVSTINIVLLLERRIMIIIILHERRYRRQEKS